MGNIIKWIFAGSLIALLASCGGDISERGGTTIGNGIPGRDLSPLTADEKKRVQTVAQEASDMEAVTDSRDVTKITKPTPGARQLDPRSVYSTEKGTEFEKVMADAIDQRDCVATLSPDPADPAYDPYNLDWEFSIKADAGKACPINYVEATKMTVDGNTTRIDMSSHLVVDKNSDTYNRFDITEYKHNMGINTTSLEQTETSQKMKMKGEGSGYFLSKTEGRIDVGLAMTGDMDFQFNKATQLLDATMAFTVTVEMIFEKGIRVTGFVLNQIRIVGDQTLQDKTTYYVNGRQVGPEEFNALFTMDIMEQDTLTSSANNVQTGEF
ncbi:MAG: hypothetical protein HRT44_04905 [Bdellovibrionales bacterium]|nr:hypothetical protein [Bdellovibrionales bacterium]NQZ18581.1 hypothetical protein [Bdellovibrionales bacterium]